MSRLPVAFSLLLSVLFATGPVRGQTSNSGTPQDHPSTPPAGGKNAQSSPPADAAGAIPANAPRMSKQTRYEIIQDFVTQLVYARTAFPMGHRGLTLRNGVLTPNGPELDQLLAIAGPSIKPGDPAHISYIRIKDNYIHLELNGGPIRRKKWYQRIQIEGADGTAVPLANGDETDNPHGSYLDVYFGKYVPEMTAAQLRNLLFPALDFTAHNKEEAYLNTVPPKVKDAIKAHQVLVGMNPEMVIHAMGKPPRKVREKDGDTEYEEWIYGQPPQDVDFVRFVGDEVVRLEIMKVGGEKIVHTQKEVFLDKSDKDAEARKQQQERPANAPSLRRPGENSQDVPNPSNGPTPTPPAVPPDIPQPPGNPGPGEIVRAR